MYIRVSVTPKSKKETIIQTDENRFTISVKEPAQNNLANSRVIDMIKEYFPNARRVRIINGHQSRTKLLDVDLGDW